MAGSRRLLPLCVRTGEERVRSREPAPACKIAFRTFHLFRLTPGLRVPCLSERESRIWLIFLFGSHTRDDALNQRSRLCSKLPAGFEAGREMHCLVALLPKQPAGSVVLIQEARSLSLSCARLLNATLNKVPSSLCNGVCFQAGDLSRLLQVSHHPPISCWWSESSSGWQYWGEVELRSKFWGKSVEMMPTGGRNRAHRLALPAAKAVLGRAR